MSKQAKWLHSGCTACTCPGRHCQTRRKKQGVHSAAAPLTTISQAHGSSECMLTAGHAQAAQASYTGKASVVHASQVYLSTCMRHSSEAALAARKPGLTRHGFARCASLKWLPTACKNGETSSAGHAAQETSCALQVSMAEGKGIRNKGQGHQLKLQVTCSGCRRASRQCGNKCWTVASWQVAVQPVCQKSVM